VLVLEKSRRKQGIRRLDGRSEKVERETLSMMMMMMIMVMMLMLLLGLSVVLRELSCLTSRSRAMDRGY
jgi:hypothetical protein